MKTGLVGFQGGGKSTVFELLTATAPDPAKAHTGQVGLAIVADARFDKLVEHYRPGKEVPARIELLDTPGLDRRQQDVNPQRLAVIREAQALVQVVGAFGDIDAVEEVERFSEEMALADLQIVSSRVSRLEVDATKPRPDREELQAELEALDESDRAEMALELGLSGSCRNELMQAILRTADLITFYTCAEKEVHAWLLRRGSSAVDAADSIHSDLARGFIRAEVTPCDKLLELGGEKEVKAAGLWHVEGKDYVVQDGDELFIRSGV